MKTRIIYLLLLIIVVIICSRVVSTERAESRYIIRAGWPGVTVTAQKLNCGLDECTPIFPDRGAWSFRQWYWSVCDLDATHRVLRDLPSGGCKSLPVKSEQFRMPAVASDQRALSELSDRAGVGCGG